MKLWINGQEFEYADNRTLTEVLQQFAAKAPFAVMVNQEFIAQSQYPTQVLHEGDQIEVLSAIQGG